MGLRICTSNDDEICNERKRKSSINNFKFAVEVSIDVFFALSYMLSFLRMGIVPSSSLR